MIVETFSVASQVDPNYLQGKNVVILDILRATTNIVYALANGCQEIIPFRTVEEALCLAGSLPKGTYLLGGERKREKIEGFDLGNSPKEYSPLIVKDKILIFTTTNGTTAINQAALAENILIASFLNISSVAKYLLSLEGNIVILCAGTGGRFSLEDSLAAGLLLNLLLKGRTDLSFDDLSLALLDLYHIYKDNIEQVLSFSENGKSLIAMGKEEDIRAAALIDTHFLVPIVREGIIKPVSC